MRPASFTVLSGPAALRSAARSAKRTLCRLFGSLVLGLLLAGQPLAASSSLPATLAPDFPQSGPLNAAQSQELLRSGASFFLLDVRTSGEFEDGHLPGAVLIPVDQLERRLAEVPDGPVVIVCRTGRRAAWAWQRLQQLRPGQQIWYIRATPAYRADGSWTIR